jgi:hypothetical protein
VLQWPLRRVVEEPQRVDHVSAGPLPELGHLHPPQARREGDGGFDHRLVPLLARQPERPPLPALRKADDVHLPR